jgi:hypothetical protein
MLETTTTMIFILKKAGSKASSSLTPQKPVSRPTKQSITIEKIYISFDFLQMPCCNIPFAFGSALQGNYRMLLCPYLIAKVKTFIKIFLNNSSGKYWRKVIAAP